MPYPDLPAHGHRGLGVDPWCRRGAAPPLFPVHVDARRPCTIVVDDAFCVVVSSRARRRDGLLRWLATPKQVQPAHSEQ